MKVKPKSASTAFGRKAPAPAPKPEPRAKEPPKSFVELAAQGMHRMPEKGSKKLSAGSKALNGGRRQGMRAEEDYDVPVARAGVTKLQLGVRGNAGPVIVNYDYDDDENSAVGGAKGSHKSTVAAAGGGGGLRALQDKVAAGSTKNSNKISWGRDEHRDSNSELQGVSEVLYNNDDQLDRLLMKAKKTRAVGFDDDD